MTVFLKLSSGPGCRACPAPGKSLAGFSLQTLKEGPVRERKQAEWTSVIGDPLSPPWRHTALPVFRGPSQSGSHQPQHPGSR